MNLNRAYQACALALAVLGVLGYAAAARQTTVGTPGLLVWALPALCTGWYLSSRRSFTLPRAAVNALLTGALGYAILRSLSSVDVSTVAELVIFLLVIKVGDRRSPRDDGQIISLSVFLAISAMLTGNSLLVGLVLLAFLPLLVATVMLFQLQSGWIAAQSGESAQTAPPRWAETSVPGLAHFLRRTVAASSIGILIVSFVVFVILPRGVGENFFGQFGHVAANGTKIAFTDKVSLGDDGLINDNPEIAFTAEFLQESGDNVGGSDTYFYLRGAVLDEYTNPGTWTSSEAAKNSESLTVTAERPTAQLLHKTTSPTAASIPLLEQVIRFPGPPAPSNQNHLFLLWRPISVEVPRTGTVHFSSASATASFVPERAERKEVVRSTVNEEFEPFTYRVKSATVEFGSEEPTERTPVSFTSTAIHELASHILTTAKLNPDPQARPISDDARSARVIQDYLRKTYTYTLQEVSPPSGQDPIENFLFNTRSGHCEYFASAMVALCRSVGINARIVAGYLAADFNPATGQYTVRQSDAHAWVEAEGGTGRWRRFDPTPPPDLDRLHRPQPGLFSRLRNALDAAEFAWNQSVVGFDEHAREMILAPTARPGDAIASRLEGLSVRVRLGGVRLMMEALGRGIVTFGAVALAGFSLSYLISLTPRARRARRPPEPRALRFYPGLLAALARRGVAKPAWRPPLDHAASLADAEIGGSARALTALYYRARFGGKNPTSGELADAWATLRRIRR